VQKFWNWRGTGLGWGGEAGRQIGAPASDGGIPEAKERSGVFPGLSFLACSLFAGTVAIRVRYEFNARWRRLQS
jgi:hypothetical protein